MNEKRDSNNILLSDHERLTVVGRVLRKYSLDELPQLFNILKGDMSLVGPRPLLPEYLPLYTPAQAARHNVRPGITGWAQINGRNSISWDEKFKFDVWYVNNISFTLDFRIIIMTVRSFFRTQDVNATQHTTMEKFNGIN